MSTDRVGVNGHWVRVNRETVNVYVGDVYVNVGVSSVNGQRDIVGINIVSGSEKGIDMVLFA